MSDWSGAHQLALLWQSCVLGIALGFIFDFFNVPSKTRRRRRLTVFLCDVIFFVMAAIVTFYFSLVVMDGRMHPLLFCGSFLGLIVQHLVAGRLFSRLLYHAARFIGNIFHHFFHWLSVPFGRIFSAILRVLLLLRSKIGKNAGKSQKKSDFFQKNT